MFKVALRYFGDFPHENSNIFEKIFYDYFGGKSVFPKIRKNRFPVKMIKKYVWKNIRIFMWKIAEMIILNNFKNPVSSNILSSEEEGQSHFQKRRKGAASAPR